MGIVTAPTALSQQEWTARRDAHVERVRRWTGPHLERKAAGVKHPIMDFLFSYYSFRPSRMERWHPGPGVVLEGELARDYLRWPFYRETPEGVSLDRERFTEERLTTIGFTHRLLTATASRAPRLGCFGLHEWAMVYRLPQEQVRHSALPLRLGPEGTDAVVESQRVQCGHYDAFRFFTPEARPRNALTPTLDSRVELEQPGCLHTSMDLFKWAYKLDPATPSELVVDCFELAVRVRELDMRASPYDVSAFGHSPVRIETPEGRADYARRQSAFADEAAPLRAALIGLTSALLDGAALLDGSPASG
ncbi:MULTISPECIES: 3-methyladenine DNA glycosylase [Actinosynnema]|uniref:3-methyladenine DNA glycosylase n=1 Tax=Actinosynnema TaxID=40566 RepID=UPI0020A35F82|nr:3-methyladenine DNA glycosylase [Actinosynnema pretiosum]MCP2098318.1 hypothetical protein [Actinosynnema pretiosum]